MSDSDIVTSSNLVALSEASKNASEQANLLIERHLQLLADTSSLSADQITEIVKDGKLLSANLGNLRSQYSAAQFDAREAKQETLEKRQEVDRLHLQLQNLYYEQRHLQGEITACESYE